MWRIIRWIGGILLGLLLVVITVAGVSLWWVSSQPKSFDECMISEMRGVDAALIENVRAVCEKRFFVQIKRAPSKSEWMWSAEGMEVIVTLMAPFSSEFSPIKAEARISPKLCNVSLLTDFTDTTLWGIGDDLRGIYAAGDAKCMTLESVLVTRR